MTRKEHIEWAKKRALDALESAGPAMAIASMNSDLGKHPETASSLTIAAITAYGLYTSGEPTNAEVKHWIEGFN